MKSAGGLGRVEDDEGCKGGYGSVGTRAFKTNS